MGAAGKRIVHLESALIGEDHAKHAGGGFRLQRAVEHRGQVGRDEVEAAIAPYRRFINTAVKRSLPLEDVPDLDDVTFATCDDGIEILHSDHSCIVNQREIGLDTPDFTQALRRALRQDPDVILIGELRDAETAQTALQAAESGHLVLSTMHTVDAAETIGRMVEFFPAGKQQMIRSIMAGVLRGIVSQRLLPRIAGGRIAAVEVMVTNSRIADLIRDNQPESGIDAIEEGAFFDMQSFTQALLDLVVTENVDREIAANAATNRHDFLVSLERALKQRTADVKAAEKRAEAETKAAAEENELPGLRLARAE